VAQQGLDAMQSLGVTLVPSDTGNPSKQNFSSYDLEQAIKPRTQPQFPGSVRSEPPDAGICATLTAAAASKLVDGPSKDLASHWNWKAVHSSDRAAHCAKVI
jgi:hypothetical protein